LGIGALTANLLPANLLLAEGIHDNIFVCICKEESQSSEILKFN